MFSKFFRVPGEQSSSNEEDDLGDLSDHESEDPSDHESADLSDHESADASDHESGDASHHESADLSHHESGDASHHESADLSHHESADLSRDESGDLNDHERENIKAKVDRRNRTNEDGSVKKCEKDDTSLSRLERDFEIINPHGHGSFGQIIKCRHRIDENIYVVKRVVAEDNGIPFEIFALSRLQHKYIVRFHQVWKEPYVYLGCTSSSDDNSTVALNRINNPDCHYIQMEFCPGTLSKLWDKKLNVDVHKAWDIFTQLVEAVSFIHQNGFIHCDLNLENVLLDSEENVKVCDFGLGRFQEGKEDERASVMDLSLLCLANIHYRAPELMNRESITEKADIYSMGVIAVDLFHLTYTESFEKRMEFLKKKELPDILKNEDPWIRDLLVSMIDNNPACRPSAEKVHRVLAQNKKSVPFPVLILVQATRFIARAAQPLFKAGCKVLLNMGTDIEDAEEVLNELISYGHKAHLYVSDLLTENDVDSMIKMAVDAWGTIDVLINNEGKSSTTLLELSDFTDVSNRVSCCTKAVGEIMTMNKKGIIINMSSSNLIGMLTQAFAKEFAKCNISVNAIIGTFAENPGNTDALSERPWQLEEVASIMEMLLFGSAAKYIIGHIFRTSDFGCTK